MALKWPDKDPDEQLDFSVDWSRYLDTDTISSVVWKVEDSAGDIHTPWVDAETINGLQRVSASNTNTVATLQLSLGDANTVYTVYCSITTSSGLSTQRKILLKVRER